MPGHPSLRWEKSAHKGTANKRAGFDANGNAIEYDADSGPAGPQGEQGIQGSAGAQGATGAQGVQGLIGLQGVQGETGSQGLQGLQGIQGEAGAQGIQGLTGDQGLQGIQGETGAAGTPGSVWREGTGVPSDALGINGDFYLDDATGDVYQKAAGTYSTVANIKGLQGNQGIQGAEGPQGIQGIQGDQGIQGVQGDPGPIGIVWRGNWSGATAYSILDGVASAGSSYICIQAHTNQIPPNITYWNVLANKGDQGIQGVQGDTGPAGPAHVTTAGDIEYHDGTSASRLPVGLGGDILTVDTSLPGKLRYAPLNETFVRYAITSLTANQVKALRATPIICIPAQGAGKTIEFISAVLALNYGNIAYAFVAGDDLQFKYVDGAGAPVSLVAETTGWLNATGDRLRIVNAQGSPTFTKAQCENKNVVLHNIGGAEIIDGDSPVLIY